MRTTRIWIIHGSLIRRTCSATDGMKIEELEMSRVKKPGNKFANVVKYDSSVTGPSKMTRIHSENEDFHKASNLSSWLFMKYDMSYKTYRNKSKARRDELREEYAEDTGADIRTRQERDWDDTMMLLADCGVPFAPDGTPLGIGWDD